MWYSPSNASCHECQFFPSYLPSVGRCAIIKQNADIFNHSTYFSVWFKVDLDRNKFFLSSHLLLWHWHFTEWHIMSLFMVYLKIMNIQVWLILFLRFFFFSLSVTSFSFFIHILGLVQLSLCLLGSKFMTNDQLLSFLNFSYSMSCFSHYAVSLAPLVVLFAHLLVIVNKKSIVYIAPKMSIFWFLYNSVLHPAF